MSGIIWDHYEKVPGKTVAKCILCRKEYSYKTSITNLKKHLNHKHLSDYQNFLNSNQTRAIGTTGRLENIWDHYEKVPGKTVAKCILCRNEYSYKTSITNLKKHLNHKHLSAYQNFLNSYQTRATGTTGRLENLQVSVIKPVARSSMEMDTSEQPLILCPAAANVQTVPPCTLRNQQQQAITAYVPCKMDEKRKKDIDKKFLQMITQDYQPFSVVEDKGFKSFVEALNPSYVLPNRKLISRTLIPGQYLECKGQIINLVQNSKKVCLTTDCWTSIDMDSYLAVTAHFLIDFELKIVLLHCEQFSGSPTADALAAALIKIASEWNVTNKITLIVSDNAPNITSAIQKTGWPFFGCFLHKLNIIIEKAMKIIELILELVKKIVAHFKKSSIATEKLVKYQTDYEKKSEALRLIQSVPTRWNSVFYMLERFIKLQGALQVVMPNLKTDLPIITVEIWEAIRQICLILKPFEEITRVMSGNRYLTASLAIVIIDGLKNVLSIMKKKPIFGVAGDFLRKLEEGMTIYFPENEVEDNMLLGMCTFLDPRFKSRAFLEDYSHLDTIHSEDMNQRTLRAYLIKEHVLELLKTKLRDKRPVADVVQEVPCTLTSIAEEDIESISIWGKIDKTIAAITPSVDDITTKAKNELDMFLKEEVVQRESSPIAWWKSHAFIFPNLGEIFHEHCHIVVTSVECERVFSKEGIFLTQKRARLSRKRTSELVFLKSNEAYCN